MNFTSFPSLMLMVPFAQTTSQHCSYPALENISVLGCMLSARSASYCAYAALRLPDLTWWGMGNHRWRKKGKKTDQSIFKLKTPLPSHMVGIGRSNCTVGCAYMLWRKLHCHSKPKSLCNADNKSGEECEQRDTQNNGQPDVLPKTYKISL